MLNLSLFGLLPLLASLGDARPVDRALKLEGMAKREVPQELSHKKFLTAVQTSLQTNNPAGIVDPVFGLLGDAAASQGAGSITNLACLQQNTADQAFTNAKAANDVEGMTNALIYRALERNTGQVGLASAICDETAVNPEIAAVAQHQDPASNGAAATNKAIVLALAQQLASIGADLQLALESGTFTPGDVNDNTGAGNTCDDANDAEGCIFTQNLLVEDASAAEIDAAAGGGGGGSAAASGAAASDTSNSSTGNAADQSSAGGSATATSGTNVAAAANIDIGQCTDFSMTFAAGLDGRKADEFTFIPTDQTNFNHGSALNPKIITEFMCDTFVNACGKSKNTQTATNIDAQLDSGALTQDQAYADAWLSGLEAAFGIQSSGTESGNGAAAGGAATGGATSTGTGSAANNSGAGQTDAGSSNDTSAGTGGGNNAAASGNNVQAFTGALNGVTAPPVTEDDSSNRPFSVNGDTFVNKGAAIQRSCAVQNNGCANAFNSGSGTSPVSDCNAQEQQCNAAGGA